MSTNIKIKIKITITRICEFCKKIYNSHNKTALKSINLYPLNLITKAENRMINVSGF